MTKTEVVLNDNEQSLVKKRREFFLRSAQMIGAGALATGVLRAQATSVNPDIPLLNYALTLEHLEATFYNQGLAKYTASDLSSGTYGNAIGMGVTNTLYSNLMRVRDHENAHVATLQTVIRALGGVPVAACTYNFPYSTPDEFLSTAALLENTGVMAYDGALALIQTPELQTAGATIATVEARHASYLNLVTGAVPFPSAVDTAKTMAEIVAAITPLLANCPTGPTTTAILSPKLQTAVTNNITLDASNSMAADGGALTYSFRQVSGNSAAILRGTTPKPLVQVPGFGTYVFEVTVTDAKGFAATDRATIMYAGR